MATAIVRLTVLIALLRGMKVNGEATVKEKRKPGDGAKSIAVDVKDDLTAVKFFPRQTCNDVGFTSSSDEISFNKYVDGEESSSGIGSPRS